MPRLDSFGFSLILALTTALSACGHSEAEWQAKVREVNELYARLDQERAARAGACGSAAPAPPAGITTTSPPVTRDTLNLEVLDAWSNGMLREVIGRVTGPVITEGRLINSEDATEYYTKAGFTAEDISLIMRSINVGTRSYLAYKKPSLTPEQYEELTASIGETAQSWVALLGRMQSRMAQTRTGQPGVIQTR